MNLFEYNYSGEPVKCQVLFFIFLYFFGELVYHYSEVKKMPTEKPRFTITLDDDLLQKIDDFRFDNRYPNRTQATLELIRIGIRTLEQQKKEGASTQDSSIK